MGVTDYAKAAAATRLIYETDLAYEARKARIQEFFHIVEYHMQKEMQAATEELGKQGLPGFANYAYDHKRRIEFTVAATKRKCIVFLVIGDLPQRLLFISVQLHGAGTVQQWNVGFDRETSSLRWIKSGYGDSIRKEEVSAAQVAQLVVSGVLSDHFE